MIRYCKLFIFKSSYTVGVVMMKVTFDYYKKNNVFLPIL